MQATGQQDIALGQFRLDCVRRSLTRNGVPVSVGGRALDVLVALASAAGETVAKDALLDKVWPGLTVEENNLQVQISALRKTLGEGRIVTVPGRGYRLVVAHKNDAPAPNDGLAGKPSIAVLPFVNMSGDAEQEYFADGMAEDIITALSRMQSFFVIARSSSFTYKGRPVDVRQVGRELGVRYVVEGSVRPTATHLRVSAQLIDAETGNHIWAERYDCALETVFSIQDCITEALTTAINPAVADAELRRALRKPPENLGAWEAYQRGLWHMGKANAIDNERAREFFRRAIELDPTFAAPHAMLAYAREWRFASDGIRPEHDTMEPAEVEARRAIELDPDDPIAGAVMSWAAMMEGDYSVALERAEHAISVAPNDAVAWLAKGRVLVFSGQPDEACAAIQTAIRLSPRSPVGWIALLTLAIGHYFMRDYSAAAQVAQRAIRAHPDFPLPYRWLAAALGQLGRIDEARDALRKAIKVSPASFEFYAHGQAHGSAPRTTSICWMDCASLAGRADPGGRQVLAFPIG